MQASAKEQQNRQGPFQGKEALKPSDWLAEKVVVLGFFKQKVFQKCLTFQHSVSFSRTALPRTELRRTSEIRMWVARSAPNTRTILGYHPNHGSSTEKPKKDYDPQILEL